MSEPLFYKYIKEELHDDAVMYTSYPAAYSKILIAQLPNGRWNVEPDTPVFPEESFATKKEAVEYAERNMETVLREEIRDNNRCQIVKDITKDLLEKECQTEDDKCRIAKEITEDIVEKECQTEKRRRIINTVRNILAKENCVLEAYIFGSFARSDFKETSDIDIYIIHSPECPIKTRYYYNDMIGEIDGHKIDCGVEHIGELEKGRITKWNRENIQDTLRGYKHFIKVK